MRVKKKPNMNKFIKRVENTPDNLYRIGNEIITLIINRTQSGRDKSDKPFKSYTQGYRQSKSEDGYGASKVNLTRSQNMLNAIRYKKYGQGLRIYFGNKKENEKAVGNQKKRKFFGLTKREQKYILKQLERMF